MKTKSYHPDETLDTFKGSHIQSIPMVTAWDEVDEDDDDDCCECCFNDCGPDGPSCEETCDSIHGA